MTTHSPQERVHIRWSIRWKLTALMTLLIVSLVIMLTSLQISSQKSVLEDELNKRIRLMRENLIERGKSVMTTLTQQVENDLAAFNFSGMIEAVRSSVNENDEIKYAMLVDSGGTIYVHTLFPEKVQSKAVSERDQLAAKQTAPAVFEWREAEERVIEIISPIQISTHPWGNLRLVYTLERLYGEIEASKKQIRRQIRRMAYKSLLISCAFMGLAFVLVFFLSTRFSQPLISLTHAARKLSQGNFSVSLDRQINSQDEVGVLAASFMQMSRDLKLSYEQLEEYSRTLEHKVDERTHALNKSLRNVEQANQKIMESLEYAKLIQRSMLPNRERMRQRLPQSFILWMPRDVVGGDIFCIEFLGNDYLIAVMDCTGHGVPGAFMTMIASSGLKRILQEDEWHSPADILKRLNGLVKTSLQQDTAYARSDDGLDASVCLVQPQQAQVVFAGAKLPVFVTRDNGTVSEIKGDRRSLGYRRSDPAFDFTNQTIPIRAGMTLYMSTDGFIDQLGGTRQRRFGSARFKTLLRQHAQTPLERQKDLFLKAFNEYKEDKETQDDVTVVGFRLGEVT